jgi:hypothetical protein
MKPACESTFFLSVLAVLFPCPKVKNWGLTPVYKMDLIEGRWHKNHDFSYIQSFFKSRANFKTLLVLKLALQFLIFSCDWQEKIRNVRMVVEALSIVAGLLKEPQSFDF